MRASSLSGKRSGISGAGYAALDVMFQGHVARYGEVAEYPGRRRQTKHRGRTQRHRRNPRCCHTYRVLQLHRKLWVQLNLNANCSSRTISLAAVLALGSDE